ncbi:MAG: NAD(P)-dependent oxidoreductase [Actinobacteria bacterium]|nr:NAD(P)-dependent oxidoreductase [Actinomycetota bacterium]
MGESPAAPAGAGAPGVGVVGLGTMGGQMARHLLAAGYRLIGRDAEPGRAAAVTALGGIAAASPAEVAAGAGTVILSLPSVAEFEQVIGGTDGLVSGARPGLAVIETSTLPLPVKERARLLLADRGAVMLDCPISGTGAQIRGKDVVIYASGDPATLADVRPVLAAFSRAQVDLGAFGNGTKLKLVANLLVTIHNVAAAEALLLAGRAGLDPRQSLAALTAGAGTSRMLEVRGPLMVAGEYGEASMRVGTFQKDLDLIAGFARELGCPAPVFTAAAQVHLAALAGGRADEDTASVFAVLEQLAGEPGAASGAAPPSVSSRSQATYDD